MASDDRGGVGSDPTRGTGPGKVTEMRPAELDAPPHALDNEPSGSGMPDPARGGCLKFGWGCLPVLLGFVLIPAGLFF
ncbi:hypothetical protein [Allosphingosinicella sp.]|uniref:hypothetical protein n=1 Tax=Allosphingosinicella sp. TaxID=2823234 RepID=UPI002F0D6C83